MKITDEKLSAFLDAELAPDEMEIVRLALESDDDLVMRLAELSQVDQWVVENAEQIDTKPIPNKLIQLAQQIDQGKKQSNVVQMSAWKTATSKLGTPMSMAAGVMLAITVGVVSMSYQQDQMISNQVAKVLDSSISGEVNTIDSDMNVKAQLSFANKQGDLCRQYLLVEKQTASTNIACKKNNTWQLHASVQANEYNTQDYQAASKDQNLDKVIDGMIAGAPLNRDQEQSAILKQWQSK